MNPNLLIVDDEKPTRDGLRAALEDRYEVYVAEDAASAANLLEAESFEVLLTDFRLPNNEDGMKLIARAKSLAKPPICILMTAYGSEELAVEALKQGADDYLAKGRMQIDELETRIARALKLRTLESENKTLKQQLNKKFGLENIIGESEPMQKVMDIVRQVAPSRATVLIQGESGTGKELLAKAIHQLSPRSRRPMVTVHCAALSPTLLESELFGHEKGSFTGASAQRIGKFEQCDKGTLFLDEIGDMMLATQAKILRVLQNGTIERVGGNNPITVDVRIIAATNKRLEEAVAAKEFREDLFYRLNVVRISLPALRERREDIALLVDYFLKTIANAEGRKPKSILGDALELLAQYGWPGNVRELENVIRRTIVMAKGEAIRAADLPADIRSGRRVPAGSNQALGQAEPPPAAANDLGSIAATLFQWAKEQPDLAVLPAVERELIAHALRETNGNQVRAARLLGITRATLRKRIEKFGIKQAVSVE